VVDFIEANIDQDLPLASLARVAAMSVYHFARRFKETVGVSPHAYVVMRRIRRAQRMLERGKDPLADVAAACGFFNQAHFTTTFQRSIGVTPGAYRRVSSSPVRGHTGFKRSAIVRLEPSRDSSRLQQPDANYDPNQPGSFVIHTH
jgi:transcriptional regulator GlxA family with amidase domain